MHHMTSVHLQHVAYGTTYLKTQHYEPLKRSKQGNVLVKKCWECCLCFSWCNRAKK